MVYEFKGRWGTYKVSLMPYFQGSGHDKWGKFKVESNQQSHMKADYLEIWGTKIYTSGKRNGKKYKIQAQLAKPLTGMSGDFQVNDMQNGKTYYQQHSLTKQTLGATWMSAHANYMTFHLGGEEYLNLHTPDMIKIPQVSEVAAASGAPTPLVATLIPLQGSAIMC